MTGSTDRTSMGSQESLVDIIVNLHAVQVLELARDTNKRYQDIAKEIFPDEEVDKEVNRFSLAVSRALKILIPDELPELTRQRKVLTGKRNVAKDPQKNREILASGRVTTAKIGSKASHEARGIVPWQEGEMDLIMTLVSTTDLHTLSMAKGTRPSYKKIAKLINDTFHSGRDVRNSDNLFKVVADRKRKTEKPVQ